MAKIFKNKIWAVVAALFAVFLICCGVNAIWANFYIATWVRVVEYGKNSDGADEFLSYEVKFDEYYLFKNGDCEAALENLSADYMPSKDRGVYVFCGKNCSKFAFESYGGFGEESKYCKYSLSGSISGK
jgi:hypothetical protein